MGPKDKTDGTPQECVFCYSSEENEEAYGKMLRKSGISIHYFCMLFSSDLWQRGKRDCDGILGFMPSDIRREQRRGIRLFCVYCKKKGASIRCSVKKCGKQFHFRCVREAGGLCQFYEEFRAYCPQHRPHQQASVLPKADESRCSSLCCICMQAVSPHVSPHTLCSPCCGGSWFHRICIQRYAVTAGAYFLKCPLCNNKQQFESEMLKFGIYIPEQDAAWELEPNAYQELLERYHNCDTHTCLCPQGRGYVGQAGSEWELVLCTLCGSSGTHVKCRGFVDNGRKSMCPECAHITQKMQKKRRKVWRQQRGGERWGPQVAGSVEELHQQLQEQRLTLAKARRVTQRRDTRNSGDEEGPSTSQQPSLEVSDCESEDDDPASIVSPSILHDGRLFDSTPVVRIERAHCEVAVPPSDSEGEVNVWDSEEEVDLVDSEEDSSSCGGQSEEGSGPGCARLISFLQLSLARQPGRHISASGSWDVRKGIDSGQQKVVLVPTTTAESSTHKESAVPRATTTSQRQLPPQSSSTVAVSKDTPCCSESGGPVQQSQRTHQSQQREPPTLIPASGNCGEDCGKPETDSEKHNRFFITSDRRAAFRQMVPALKLKPKQQQTSEEWEVFQVSDSSSDGEGGDQPESTTTLRQPAETMALETSTSQDKEGVTQPGVPQKRGKKATTYVEIIRLLGQDLPSVFPTSVGCDPCPGVSSSEVRSASATEDIGCGSVQQQQQQQQQGGCAWSLQRAASPASAVQQQQSRGRGRRPAGRGGTSRAQGKGLSLTTKASPRQQTGGGAMSEMSHGGIRRARHPRTTAHNARFSLQKRRRKGSDDQTLCPSASVAPADDVIAMRQSFQSSCYSQFQIPKPAAVSLCGAASRPLPPLPAGTTAALAQPSAQSAGTGPGLPPPPPPPPPQRWQGAQPHIRRHLASHPRLTSVFGAGTDSSCSRFFSVWQRVRQPEPAVQSQPVPAVQSQPVPAVQSQPARGALPAVQSQPARGALPAVQSQPACGALPAVQSWPACGAPCAVQSQPARGALPAVQSQPARGAPCAVQSQPARGALPAVQSQPARGAPCADLTAVGGTPSVVHVQGALSVAGASGQTGGPRLAVVSSSLPAVPTASMGKGAGGDQPFYITVPSTQPFQFGVVTMHPHNPAVPQTSVTGVTGVPAASPYKVTVMGSQPQAPSAAAPFLPLVTQNSVPVVQWIPLSQCFPSSLGQPSTHLQIQGQPSAHLQIQGQIQGQPSAHLQIQGQPSTHLQTQGQPSAPLQIQGQPSTHLQTQGQPSTHLQTQGQPSAHLQTQGQPSTHLQIQGQIQGQPSAPLQIQGQPSAPLQIQGQLQGQPSAPLQIQGQIQGQPSAHLQTQGQPSAPLQIQGQLQGQPSAPLQIQGQIQGQPSAPLQIQGQIQGHPSAHLQTQGQPSTHLQTQGQPSTHLQIQGQIQGQTQGKPSAPLQIQGQQHSRPTATLSALHSLPPEWQRAVRASQRSGDSAVGVQHNSLVSQRDSAVSVQHNSLVSQRLSAPEPTLSSDKAAAGCSDQQRSSRNLPSSALTSSSFNDRENGVRSNCRSSRRLPLVTALFDQSCCRSAAWSGQCGLSEQTCGCVLSQRGTDPVPRCCGESEEVASPASSGGSDLEEEACPGRTQDMVPVTSPSPSPVMTFSQTSASVTHTVCGDKPCPSTTVSTPQKNLLRAAGLYCSPPERAESLASTGLARSTLPAPGRSTTPGRPATSAVPSRVARVPPNTSALCSSPSRSCSPEAHTAVTTSSSRDERCALLNKPHTAASPQAPAESDPQIRKNGAAAKVKQAMVPEAVSDKEQQLRGDTAALPPVVPEAVSDKEQQLRGDTAALPPVVPEAVSDKEQQLRGDTAALPPVVPEAVSDKEQQLRGDTAALPPVVPEAVSDKEQQLRGDTAALPPVVPEAVSDKEQQLRGDTAALPPVVPEAVSDKEQQLRGDTAALPPVVPEAVSDKEQQLRGDTAALPPVVPEAVSDKEQQLRGDTAALPPVVPSVDGDSSLAISQGKVCLNSEMQKNNVVLLSDSEDGSDRDLEITGISSRKTAGTGPKVRHFRCSGAHHGNKGPAAVSHSGSDSPQITGMLVPAPHKPPCPVHGHFRLVHHPRPTVPAKRNADGSLSIDLTSDEPQPKRARIERVSVSDNDSDLEIIG